MEALKILLVFSMVQDGNTILSYRKYVTIVSRLVAWTRRIFDDYDSDYLEDNYDGEVIRRKSDRPEFPPPMTLYHFLETSSLPIRKERKPVRFVGGAVPPRSNFKERRRNREVVRKVWKKQLRSKFKTPIFVNDP